MKLVFYSIILNNHQANIADELWSNPVNERKPTYDYYQLEAEITGTCAAE